MPYLSIKSAKLAVNRSPEYVNPAAADNPAPPPINIHSAFSMQFFARSILSCKLSFIMLFILTQKYVEDHFQRTSRFLFPFLYGLNGKMAGFLLRIAILSRRDAAKSDRFKVHLIRFIQTGEIAVFQIAFIRLRHLSMHAQRPSK